MTALPKIQRDRLPEPDRSASNLIICQGMVPRELLLATREVYIANGLTTGKFLTWALSEYLRATNPEKAEEVLGAIRYA